VDLYSTMGRPANWRPLLRNDLRGLARKVGIFEDSFYGNDIGLYLNGLTDYPV
jgi:hypothetical protein